MVEYALHIGSPLETGADTVAIVVGKELRGEAAAIDEELGKCLARSVESGDFRGEAGWIQVYYPPRARYIAASSGGDGVEGVRVAVAAIVRKARELKVRHLAIYLPGDLGVDSRAMIREAAVAAVMAYYDPQDTYRSREKKQVSLEKITLCTKGVGFDEGREALRTGLVIGEAVNYARRIADAPASDMNPETIEREARELASRYGLEIEVLHREELEKLGMNGILGVGRGGGVEPRLILLKYRGRGGTGWDLAVVGKTVTFDAGGLDLKPASYMLDMKYDKSGGAAVLGIMKAVAELRLPVNIIGALPAVENLPGRTAYKPRDILRMYNGLTVEIGNTDAEGRLILADTLSYVEKNYMPRRIIDLATLTGAIVVALGNYATGLFSNDDELAEKLLEAGEECGERLWRMPMWREYNQYLKSDFADTNNVGGRSAGAITAAMFLSKFVEKTPWAHLDIAGTAWVQGGHPKKPYYANAATGVGVRIITYMLMKETGSKQ